MTEQKTKATFEGEILLAVRNAAKARAESQARKLPAVARAVLIQASKRARPSEDGVAHPAERPTKAAKKRIRFTMDSDQYDLVKERIRQSGRSMTRALEEGLEDYARTGALDENPDSYK